MKRLFLGSVALVALSLGASAAFAAELRRPPPPPPVYAPPVNWSGCYAGFLAGTKWGRSEHTETQTGLPLTNDFDLTGFTGGFDLGCNWQVGAWIFGIEGDWTATNKEGQEASIAPFNPNFVNNTQERWETTARARLGWTIWDKSMIYVTGGAAWAKVDVSAWNITNPILTAGHGGKVLSGWVVGGGLEYLLGYGWSLRSEYLYEDFGTKTIDLVPSTFVVTPIDVKLHNHIIRAGLNYKFW
jgi:outer membrane immunogenic protein